MPDPDCERPSYMKRRARQLLFEAARLAECRSLDECLLVADGEVEMERLIGWA